MLIVKQFQRLLKWPVHCGPILRTPVLDRRLDKRTAYWTSSWGQRTIRQSHGVRFRVWDLDAQKRGQRDWGWLGSPSSANDDLRWPDDPRGNHEGIKGNHLNQIQNFACRFVKHTHEFNFARYLAACSSFKFGTRHRLHSSGSCPNKDRKVWKRNACFSHGDIG